MKKILTAAIAATLAMSSLGVASAAEAQTRGNYEQRQDRRDDRRDDRGDRREERRDEVQALFRDTLARFDAPVTVVQGTWEQRLATAAALIDSFTDTHHHG